MTLADKIRAHLEQVRAHIDCHDNHDDPLWTDAVELGAAVGLVLNLHKPERVEIVDTACADGDCEHDNDCPTREIETCQYCYRLESKWHDEAPVHPYPCVMVRSVVEALGVET